MFLGICVGFLGFVFSKFFLVFCSRVFYVFLFWCFFLVSLKKKSVFSRGFRESPENSEKKSKTLKVQTTP